MECLYFRGTQARCRHVGWLGACYTNLQRFAISPTGQPMCIYGDPAYPPRVHLKLHFVKVVLLRKCRPTTTRWVKYEFPLNGLLATLLTLLNSLITKKIWRLNSAVWERCTWYVHCFEMPSLAFIKTKLHFFSNFTLRFWKNISSNL